MCSELNSLKLQNRLTLVVTPQANKKSPQEIDVWIRDNYKELGNGWEGNLRDLSRGMSVLWKGILKGKSGGESTKYEYFHGKFHGWSDGDFVIIS
jgi:hypothetical protein